VDTYIRLAVVIDSAAGAEHLRRCAEQLGQRGYKVLEIESASRAVEIFRERDTGAMVLRAGATDAEGRPLVDLLRFEASALERPDAPLVLLADETDWTEALRLAQDGRFDAVCPLRGDPWTVVRAVDRAVELRGHCEERNHCLGVLEHARLEYDAELFASAQRLEAALDGIVSALCVLVSQRDPYTATHSSRVGRIARRLGAALGLGAPEQDALFQAGCLHDIGKITLPISVLNKPGPLNPAEFQLVLKHPQDSYAIVRHLPLPGSVGRAVWEHHERFDGTGYPHQKAGEDIHLHARILSLADVYEAMTSDRPYRRALSHAEAMHYVRAQSGRHFCPLCTDAFLRLEEGALGQPFATTHEVSLHA
jgi:response regulator RpfG family c-di-GMP phosphodiesterase